jgi:hypothetical protein
MEVVFLNVTVSGNIGQVDEQVIGIGRSTRRGAAGEQALESALAAVSKHRKLAAGAEHVTEVFDMVGMTAGGNIIYDVNMSSVEKELQGTIHLLLAIFFFSTRGGLFSFVPDAGFKPAWDVIQLHASSRLCTLLPLP